MSILFLLSSIHSHSTRLSTTNPLFLPRCNTSLKNISWRLLANKCGFHIQIVLSLLPTLPSNSNLWNTPYMKKISITFHFRKNKIMFLIISAICLICVVCFLYIYFFAFFSCAYPNFPHLNIIYCFFCYLIRYFFLFFQYFILCLNISLAASNFLNYIWYFLCTKACYPHVWIVGFHHLSKSGKRDWLITRPTWSVGMFLQ